MLPDPSPSYRFLPGRRPRRAQRAAAGHRAVTAALSAALVAGSAAVLALAGHSAGAVGTSYVSLYADSARPTNGPADDAKSVELGVQFTARSAGRIAGVRYFKFGRNRGTHTGSLWTSTGRELASATFSSESKRGWQTVMFATPVSISAGTTYVASYHTDDGAYAYSTGTFAHGDTVGNSMLTATQGVFRYGSSAFPNSTWNGSSYYVDVLFAPGGGTPIPVPPTSSAPTSSAPTSSAPTSSAPTSSAPTSSAPTSSAPTSSAPLAGPPVAGVPAGTALTPMAGTTITQPNAVISGRDITGTVTIAAPNVTITDSRIHGTGYYGVSVEEGASVTISYSTISGFENGVYGDNYTASHVELTALLDDGFKLGSHVMIDSSWCHDLTPEPGAHSDCGQLQSGEVDVTVENSWLDPNGSGGGTNANSALFIAPDLGPSSNGPVTITNNVLGGGNYALYCVNGDNGRYFVKNITITDNQFRGDSQFGDMDIDVPVTMSGNTDS